MCQHRPVDTDKVTYDALPHKNTGGAGTMFKDVPVDAVKYSQRSTSPWFSGQPRRSIHETLKDMN